MAEMLDADYWEAHWREALGRGGREIAPNPYLAALLADLEPGTALDAGCGEGAEALWLAIQGWRTTGADISAAALERAAERAGRIAAGEDRLRWVRADLARWEPDEPFDLVTTHYAHPDMAQLEFYDRIATWVAPGGTLFIVGHLHHGHGHDHGRGPLEEVSVTAESVASRFDPAEWTLVAADQPTRTATTSSGHDVVLHDVVVRLTRHR